METRKEKTISNMNWLKDISYITNVLISLCLLIFGLISVLEGELTYFLLSFIAFLLQEIYMEIKFKIND